MHELVLFFVGLLTGSLLTEGLVLAPLWRSLPAERFYELHTYGGPKLFRYFAPLTVAAVFTTIANALLGNDGSKGIVAAITLVSGLVIFFFYFKSANKKLADHAYDEEELNDALKRWAYWHHARTAIVVGFMALLVS